MRTTSKLLALILCMGITAAAFTGCGSEKPEESGTKEVEEISSDPLIEDAASYIDLAEYKTISLKKSEVDDKVQSQIDNLLENNASYKQVKKGKVKDGDTVNIYYVGKMDGKEFDGGSCTKDTMPSGYNLTIGSGQFIPGFEDALIGKKIGKTVDIDVTFPEDYSSTDLAGKPAVFTVTLNYKQGEKIMPKLDDDFVKKNLTDYTSAEDYKKKTREMTVQGMAVEKVCNESTVNKYPEDKVDAMEKQLKTSIESYLTQNNLTLDSYLSNQNKTEEDYNAEMEEEAKKDVANQLVYNAIAQAEDITIADDEYQKELKTYLTNYGCETEADLDKTFKTSYGTDAKTIIYNNLLYQKIADYLVGNVQES